MRHGLAVRASAIALAAAIAAPQVSFAQDDTDDVIVVTGSFIKRKSQADLPSPLETVGAGDIEDIGANNIADITQTLTINSGAENNPDAFTQSGTTGTTNINLRGLGLGSTLVILNGKRQVTTATQTNQGVQFVDTSSLVPLIAVDRVEILKDGASALYGSDAVAGVVNFITRDDYHGIALSGNYTSHQSQGDYNEFQIQGLAGYNFDRGNIMFAAAYSESTPLTTAERRLSVPANDTSALGNPGAFFTTADGMPVPMVPAGTPLLDPGCAAGGGFPLQASPTAPPPSSGIGLCGFDFGEFYNLVTENKRLSTFASASFEITDTVEFHIEGGYADNEDVRGNSPTFPFLQLGSAVVPGAAFGPAANPFNFFPGDPTLVFFGRAIGIGGDVSPNFTDNETWRASASLNGEYGDTGSWEISYTRARNNYTIMTEDTVTDRFQCGLSGFNSLPAVPGLTGGTDCTSANPFLTAFGDSVPAVGTFYNPFSTSLSVAPNSAALQDYIVQFQTRDLQSTLQVAEGYTSFDLFEMPAGAVGVAVGGQYRKSELEADFDEISTNDGFAFLIGEQPYSGSQDVFAGFVEVAIPIADWIDVQAAVRHERYGDDEGGSTTDPKIALLLRPTDYLSLRGSYSTSFRAPSVFQQLGQGTSLQQVVDPANGNATAFVAVRSQGAQVVGNTLLPEDSRAFNGGFTWLPVEGMEMSLDYFNFKFENVITPQNPQALLNADPMGAAIVRSPAGTVVQINTQYVNASQVKTSGLDFAWRWAVDTGSAGTFTPTVQGTYLLNYDLIDPIAGAVDGEGVRNFNNFGTSSPQLRLNTGLNWTNGAHSANIFLRHIDSYLDDQNGLATIDSDTRIDVQYRLAINEYMNRDKLAAVTIGARNLFGTTAPFVATNGGFDSKVHDPRGALLYFGVDLEL
ncbi:TonB-dependent receptor [Hyphococcus flavus]|uniref:TonB-dependent receptor n=1 Tax=Hyphococcus flavus TaxID=1866326 RepID=A0AAE9ZFF3_9PROT|nr:TonB-dependent receptor [Hyphococcus flavus]WDI32825.1 TonB-dependent receptor [Hyphococcus flavus]